MDTFQFPGFSMILHGDNYLEQEIIDKGIWEPSTTQFFRSTLQSGQTVIDIGANIGYFSLLSASLVGPEGEVHAFEPYPGYAQRMKLSLEANNFSNIHLNEFALSDKHETRKLFKGLASARIHRWTHENPIFNKVHDEVDVECICFDDYAEKKLRRLDLIKIDVDGYELNILKGARESIKKYNPIIVTEVFEEGLRDAGGSTAEMFSVFRELGYKPYSELGRLLEWDNLIAKTMANPKVSINVVFRPGINSTTTSLSKITSDNYLNTVVKESAVRPTLISEKQKLGLVIDRRFHEENRWCSATTFHLVEALKSRFECVYIQNQQNYEKNIGDVDFLVSMEPGWASPILEFTRTQALREKLAEIPSYIFYSDPHSNKWREEYFLKNEFDYVLSFYLAPFRHHFRKIQPAQLIHCPWAIPDHWMSEAPITFNGQSKVCCFGGCKGEAYELRNWCRSFEFVESATNSGVENKVMSESEYIHWLRNKDAAIAAGSDSPKYKLTVPKYFEIAAAGSLLFAQHTDDLALLGFEHKRNCIIFNRSDFEQLAKEYLANPQSYLVIRRAGQELIRQRHLLSQRMNLLDKHVSAALERRAKPVRLRQSSKNGVKKDSSKAVEPCRKSGLTSKEYWDNGRNREFKPWEVKETEFSPIFEKYLPVNDNFSCVEIGAYPGSNLCCLAKRFRYYPVAIEFSEHCDHIEKLLRFNGIKEFKVLKQDLFDPVDMKFDVVTSFGFIEHFENYEAVIDRHVDLLKPGGYLVISCPYLDNFQGRLRELVYTEDKLQQVLSSHNLDVMNLDEIKRVLSKYDVEICFSDFIMGNKIWLDWNADYVKPQMKWLVQYLTTINAIADKHIPSSKLYSPMIMIIARDKSVDGKKVSELCCKGKVLEQKQKSYSQNLCTVNDSGHKTILFIVNESNFADNSKTDNLIRCLGDSFNIKKRYNDGVTIEDIDSADLIVINCWQQLQQLNSENILKVLARNKHKLLLGICSHHEMGEADKERGLMTIRNMASAVFVDSMLLYREFAPCFEVPVFYTPEGVDMEFYTPASDRNSGERLRVGWEGSILNHIDDKDYHELIVQAIDSVPDSELVTAAHDVKLRRPDEMREFYRSLDVYICTSVTDGAANLCLEAAACGVPLLTARVGSMPELIQNGVNGLFIEHNAEDIKNKLVVMRDNPELREHMTSSILESIREWDWKRQAENYRVMFDTMLSAQDTDRDHLFKSESQVYLASADRMDRVLDNLCYSKRISFKHIDSYATVIGGLSGLNFLLEFRPKNLIFYDINISAVDYAKLVIDLICLSESPRDFISNVFCRSVEEFLEDSGHSDLRLENQQQYLSQPVDENILNRVLSLLSDTSKQSYRKYIVPHLSGQILAGVRNCRRLLPCWPINERVPVGGGEETGWDENGQRVPNTNTFFYGHGWLASKEKFLKIRETIEKSKVSFRQFDLLEEDLHCLGDLSGSFVLYASNIDAWFPQRWQEKLKQWYSQSLSQQGLLVVIGAESGVMVSDADAHIKALVALYPRVYGKVVEVTHKVPWGFHEFERTNVRVDDYLEHDYPADTTILHILIGEGVPKTTFRKVYTKAVRLSKRVIILEHNRNSADFRERNDLYFVTTAELREIIKSSDLESCAIVTCVEGISGESDTRRNIMVVLDCFAKPLALGKSVDKVSMDKCRSRILFLVDSPNWAHDFKTDNLMRVLGSKYEMKKRYNCEVTASDFDEADLIVIYYWTQLGEIKIDDIREVLIRNRGKLLFGICSHHELDGPYGEQGLKIIANLGSGVFANNPRLYEKYKPLFKIPVFYTPNGVDTKLFTPAKAGRKDKGLRAGWAGTVKSRGQKGYYEFIVPAVNSLDGVEVVAAAREDYWKSRDEMIEFYRSLDVYICASLHEGTPNPCLEAAACGLPILTTRVGNMPEFIKDGKNGFFIERDVSDIRSKLILLRDDTELRLKMSGEILRSVQAWDWDKQVENYHIMFETILTGKSSFQRSTREAENKNDVSAPRFSVVMANYNNGKYIAEAIESVINQTFSDWELIIVDDCSTDNSYEIISRYLNDGRIRLVRHSTNKGYTSALKTGISNVRSEFFGIFDSDDWLRGDAIGIMYKEHCDNPQAGLIYSQFVCCDENLEPRTTGFGAAIANGLTSLDNFSVSAFRTFKLRDYYRTSGYDENILYAEDRDICHKMEEVSQLKFVDEKLYFYRELPGSQSHDSAKADLGRQMYQLARFKAFKRRGLEPEVGIVRNDKEWGFRLRDIQDCYRLALYYLSRKNYEDAEQVLSTMLESAKQFMEYIQKGQMFCSADRQAWLSGCIYDSSVKLAYCFSRHNKLGLVAKIYSELLEADYLNISPEQRSAITSILEKLKNETFLSMQLPDDESTETGKIMEKEPLVSIVMPVYNGEKYVAKAIKSVLDQDYHNLELIVINDGSKDRTEQIVAGFKDSRIKYYKQANRGLAASHNEGIKKGRGEFLIKVDCDDFISVDFVSRHLAEFAEHPDADLVYCDDQLIKEDGQPIRVITRPEYTDRKILIRDLFKSGFPVIPFRTCIRRRVFDTIGLFDENLRIGEDYDMMRRFVKAGLKPYHLKAPLYFRRMASESLSRQYSIDKARAHFEIVDRYTQTFSHDELFPGVKWELVPSEMRQLHFKCLVAMNFISLGRTYIETDLPSYAKAALESAGQQLSNCLEIDPDNGDVRKLIDRCRQLEETLSQTVAVNA